MIFTSQSGLTDVSQLEDWARWYEGHLRVMTRVPGISTAQRFQLFDGENSPSLAMYSVASAAVFDDPRYLKVRGLGEFASVVDHRHYRRNLFEGLKLAPQVRDGDALVIIDGALPEPGFGGLDWTWLRAVAIDRSTPWRGMCVVDHRKAERLKSPRIAVYRPDGPAMIDDVDR